MHILSGPICYTLFVMAMMHILIQTWGFKFEPRVFHTTKSIQIFKSTTQVFEFENTLRYGRALHVGATVDSEMAEPNTNLSKRKVVFLGTPGVAAKSLELLHKVRKIISQILWIQDKHDVYQNCMEIF